MILLTASYQDADPKRRDELRECLQRNAENERFHEIHVFIEDPIDSEGLEFLQSLSPEKIRLIRHSRRVTFQDFFAYANRQLRNHRVVIANADIFFDSTLAFLDGFDLSGKLLCLSRWDVQPDGSAHFFEHPSSQDAWIFQSPIPKFSCKFQLGLLGCDNRLAWEAQQAGLKLSNPSRSLRAHHLHLSQVRRYTERQRLTGPSKSVPAVFMETPYPAVRREAPELPSAHVAFSEPMGYTVAQLEAGASSHNNEARPFNVIPASLVGLSFTQVVAYAVSPVEVEFLSPGKLYVLVGNDWEGHHLATTWLAKTGYRERLPLVETGDGVGFEVWSLIGETGERFVIPTQVMLVAARIERQDIRQGKRRDDQIHRNRERIYAITSLAPTQENWQQSAKCIESWRHAGLDVRAFNHPSEIARLAGTYDVEFVPTEETSAPVFGKHFIPIKVMLEWAAQQDAPVLLINSDIELRIDEWELKRIRWLADGGICYFVRYNHNGDQRRSFREWHGIDAFLLHGRDAALFRDSFLSMGQPFWDYWIPHTFASQRRNIYSVDFPAAYHRNHWQRWSWDHWLKCAHEFDRITGELGPDNSLEACVSMSVRVRQRFDQQKISLTHRPGSIRDWVQQTFNYPGPKLLLELGAHQGTDTMWMAEIPDVTIHAFEPDPRNHPAQRPNVTLHRLAIADHDGHGSLILSQHGWGQEWTHSSSIKAPLNHLLRYPVTFGEAVGVDLITLDSFCEARGIEGIDFIWADIQGAEGDMVRGGQKTLARTRYLYTEYSDDELYENQATLREILELLPDFRVIELWPDDVLLENQKLKK